MKRDMDLSRRILIDVEASTSPFDWIDIAPKEHSKEEISYHVMLLSEARLIEAIDLSDKEVFEWKPIRLTWEGHEFVEASRDEIRWEQAKRKAVDLPFEVLKAVLFDLAKRAVLGNGA